MASKMRSMVVKPGGRRRAALLMHEESDNHYQYRQCAKANHCNSKPDVSQEKCSRREESGGSKRCLTSHRWLPRVMR